MVIVFVVRFHRAGEGAGFRTSALHICQCGIPDGTLRGSIFTMSMLVERSQVSVDRYESAHGLELVTRYATFRRDEAVGGVELLIHLFPHISESVDHRLTDISESMTNSSQTLADSFDALPYNRNR